MAQEKQGKLRSVTITVAEEGYIGSCSYEPPKQTGKDSCCYPYVPDKQYALVDRKGAQKFIEKALGGGKAPRLT